MLPMPIKKISLLLSMLSMLMTTGYGQQQYYGMPFIRNFHYSQTGGSEQNWCITQDKRGVIYVGNNDKGILEFDGSTWRNIPVPGDGSVRSLASGEDGMVYAGLAGDFGRLVPDQRGDLQYHSLMDSITRKDYPDAIFWRTYYLDQKVYFCASSAIFIFDTQNGDLSVITTTEHAFLSYIINSELYTSDFSIGLMKYKDGKYITVPGGEFFIEKNIGGLLAMDSSNLLVSTFNQGLYLLDTGNGTVDSTFIDPLLKEDLESSFAVNIERDDRHIYIGSRDKGLYILDLSGELIRIVSVDEGLINNTISKVIVGSSGSGEQAIWLAHWKGVSRIDLNSPFGMQSIGQRSMGISGRNQGGEPFTDMLEFNGHIFISTMGGLHNQPVHSEHPRFRPIRGIREAISDLQVVQPSLGESFLLASAEDITYVIDQNMRVSTLPVGGRKLLIDPDDPAVFYTGSYDLRGFEYMQGSWKEILEVELKSQITDMCLDRDWIWISTWRGLLRIDDLRGPDMALTRYDSGHGLPEDVDLDLLKDPVNQDLLLGSVLGLYRFDYQSDMFVQDSAYDHLLPDGTNNFRDIRKGAKDMYWFSFENEYRGWCLRGARMTPGGFQLTHVRPFNTLPSMVPAGIVYTDSEDQLWFSKTNELYHFDESLSTEEPDTFKVLIRQVSIPGDSILFNGSHYLLDPAGNIQISRLQTDETLPSLKHIYRDVEFSWSAPYYKNEFQTQYSYLLEGHSKHWSNWSSERTVKINNLRHGRYVMQVKARNVYGDESQEASYAFTILRPWYANILAIFIYILLIIGLVAFVILYTRNLRARAEILERKNREIEKQKKKLEELNEEVTSQRDEIETQRDSLSEQKELINSQNRAMTDSIHYARRIQDAVLPDKEVMRYLLPKHFVFYRPRDIVSGDFFWVDKRDDTVLIAVADCTGHGVPGAFMSIWVFHCSMRYPASTGTTPPARSWMS